MGKVVKLDAAAAERPGPRTRLRRGAGADAVEDGAGARRRRLHRRGLRDRRAARARSALGQPHRQRVRRLRRHQRGLVRRRGGRERRHARGDDAGDRPAGPDAVPGRAPELAAEAQLPRVRRARARCCRCGVAQVVRSLLRDIGQVSAVDIGVGLAEALPSGLYYGRGHRAVRAHDPVRPGRTDDFRLLEPELYLAATDLDTCERIVFGASDWDDVPISTAVARVERAADDLQARQGQGPGADRRRDRCRRPTSTSRSRRARSSSSSSTRSSRTSTTSRSGSRR